MEDTVQKAADAFHVWLSDWNGQARAFITRRDYLIRLGLTSRKNRADDETEDEEEVFDDETTDNTVEVAAE